MEEKQRNTAPNSGTDSALDPSAPTAGESSPMAAPAEDSPDLDNLLDDIENLVADDAQNFVQGFVQKGGE